MKNGLEEETIKKIFKNVIPANILAKLKGGEIIAKESHP